MVAFQYINDSVEDFANGVHDLDTDSIEVRLTNTAPGSETNNPLNDGNGLAANLTEIAYTNLSTRSVTFASDGQTAGAYKSFFTDLVLTASGGAVADWRYIYLVNTGTVKKTNPILAMWDAGSTQSMGDGDSRTIDFDGTNGVIQINKGS